MKIPAHFIKQFEGCIIGGAIGDAWGSAYENVKSLVDDPATFYLGEKKIPVYNWAITDDTQLTLATCEAIAENDILTPELLANKFVQYYKQKKVSGIGSSTLKSLQELNTGIHWSQAGRTGEYAAGNGAAMRIAPLAFHPSFSRDDIRDICRITHRNDEAYAAALAIVVAIRAIINNEWTDNGLLQIVIDQLPDSNTRDKLIRIEALSASSIAEVSKLGTSGYAADSIPLALFAASQIKTTATETILQDIIAAGGDTDTNASLTGQVAGAFLTIERIPGDLLKKLQGLDEYDWIKSIVYSSSLVNAVK